MDIMAASSASESFDAIDWATFAFSGWECCWPEPADSVCASGFAGCSMENNPFPMPPVVVVAAAASSSQFIVFVLVFQVAASVNTGDFDSVRSFCNNILSVLPNPANASGRNQRYSQGARS
mmetsp:Transcript_108471/g.221486  ORF Transcript_108471/g.221486 Transcript_108471/m.221486 type:complete len:121 (-) Transcript_108471:171-533(-)